MVLIFLSGPCNYKWILMKIDAVIKVYGDVSRIQSTISKYKSTPSNNVLHFIVNNTNIDCLKNKAN